MILFLNDSTIMFLSSDFVPVDLPSLVNLFISSKAFMSSVGGITW